MRKLFILVVILAGAYLIRTYLAEGIYIASESMEPTLKMGAFFFVDKVSFRFNDPERFEIIVFKPPVEADDKEFVKRIIGLPGDRLEIKKKKVYINDEALQEKYIFQKRPDELLMGDDLGPLEIPADSYFVMGDNRDESRDSRDFVDSEGNHIYFIKRDAIRGRLIQIF